MSHFNAAVTSDVALYETELLAAACPGISQENLALYKSTVKHSVVLAICRQSGLVLARASSTPSAETLSFGRHGSNSPPWPAGSPGATRSQRTCSLVMPFCRVVYSGVQQGDPLGPLLFSAGVQPLAADLRSGPVDLSVFYLDDGVLAGSLAAVSGALTKLQQAAAALGLTVNLSKSEAIAVGMTPAAAVAAQLPPALVCRADGQSRILTDFEFLGAAIGGPAHLQAHAATRVEGARKLLEAVGGLADPQVALRLLRASAGYARLVHTMRCCPPAGHAAALEVFDDLVLQSFSSLSGLHLEPEQWQQAGRGLAQAGLGLRSTRTHAPAAYLASVGSSSPQCQELDPNYWIDHSGDVAAALCELNAKLSPAQQLTTAGALALSQSELSSRIDATGWASQLEGASAVDKATLLSEAAPGARAFLTCVPSGRTQMEPAVFTAELRVRLRVPESSTDAWCPKCDAILDSHGHHAGMCIAGGERTLRHNALRDLEAGFCRSGQMM